MWLIHEFLCKLLFEVVSFFSEQHQTDVNNILVIKGPFVFLDFIQSNINAKSRPVGPMRGHGLDHIGYSQDPGLLKEILLRETFRVSRAVQSFMVLDHNIGYWPGELDVLEDIVT